jgi:fluoroquinolone resistance protein
LVSVGLGVRRAAARASPTWPLGPVGLGPHRKSIPLGDILLGAVKKAARRPGVRHDTYVCILIIFNLYVKKDVLNYTKENLVSFSDYYECDSFNNIDFSKLELNEHSFQSCDFISCIFDKNNLLNCSFRDCNFQKCQFTLDEMKNTMFSDVAFNECKLIGLNFSECNNISFSVTFNGSILDSVVMFEKSLNKTKYINCFIRNTDFDNCDMRFCDFSGSKFEKTSFHKCNLEKSDFSKAIGYEIDPSTNKLKNAKFSLPEAYSFLLFLGIKLVD